MVRFALVIAGFLPYVYMFASAWKAGRRWSAFFGEAVTALAIVCSVAPTAEVGNVWLFELKLAGGTVALVVSGWFIYRRYAAAANDGRADGKTVCVTP